MEYDTETGMPDALAAGSAIQLRLLGDFTVIHDGRPVRVRQGGQRLLAFLGLQPRPVPRSRLAGALWPLRRAEQASANLRAALSRLPRPGGRLLTSSEGTQVSLAEEIEVDVRLSDAWMEELRDAAGTASSTCPEARTVPRDELLASDVLPLWDDDWVIIERERFRQARLHALERLSVVLRQSGRAEDALQAALSAVAGEPLRESAHRAVIEAHLAEGNPAEALRQYEIYRRLLRRELGLSPSDRIRQILAPLLGAPNRTGSDD